MCFGHLLLIAILQKEPMCIIFWNALYANDLPDTGTLVEDIETRVNSEVENIHVWLIVNTLTLIVKKTEYIISGSYKSIIFNNPNESEIKIRINNEINRAKSARSLGVIIDKHLM